MVCWWHDYRPSLGRRSQHSLFVLHNFTSQCWAQHQHHHYHLYISLHDRYPIELYTRDFMTFYSARGRPQATMRVLSLLKAHTSAITIRREMTPMQWKTSRRIVGSSNTSTADTRSSPRGGLHFAPWNGHLNTSTISSFLLLYALAPEVRTRYETWDITSRKESE